MAQRSVGEGFRELDPRIDYFVKHAARQNFGDYLPELFCQTLLTYPKVDADAFRLVGSVIEERWIRQDLRRANGHVRGLIAYWGCGARQATPIAPATLAHCLFFGVRGALTRDLLRLPADTVLGDPGLLAPLFHPPRPHPLTTGKAICMPHIHDRRAPNDLLAFSGAEVLVHPEIDASAAALREILDKIASASFVLTASLHGAIIACAYGRPFAFWDNGHVDLPFKWEDFATSVGVPSIFVQDLGEAQQLYAARIRPLLGLPSRAALLDTAPFVARPAALLRALALDGADDAVPFEAAAGALDRMPSLQLADIYRLQDVSATQRAQRHGLGRQTRKLAGFALRRCARWVRARR